MMKRIGIIGSKKMVRFLSPDNFRDGTIPTDKGIQFTNREKDKRAFKHLFDRNCEQHQIEHRLTKINRLWTNGQVERMNNF